MFEEELTSKDVKNIKTFGLYCQQHYGIPYPTVDDLKIAGRQYKLLVKHHPNVTWQTMLDVATWCESKGRNIPRLISYFTQFRYAYEDKAIELKTPLDVKIAREIEGILLMEDDPQERAKIMQAQGKKAQRQVINEWMNKGIV